MESSEGVSRTVGGNEKLRAVEIRGVDGGELDLHRPLAQFAHQSGLLQDGRGQRRNGSSVKRGRRRQGTRLAPGAAARKRLVRLLFLFRLLNGSGVIGRSLPLLKGNGARGAGGQAVAETVAVILPQKHGFAVHHADRAFMARLGARAAPIAFFCVNVYNFPDHSIFHPFLNGRFRACFLFLCLQHTTTGREKMLYFQQIKNYFARRYAETEIPLRKAPSAACKKIFIPLQ